MSDRFSALREGSRQGVQLTPIGKGKFCLFQRCALGFSNHVPGSMPGIDGPHKFNSTGFLFSFVLIVIVCVFMCGCARAHRYVYFLLWLFFLLGFYLFWFLFLWSVLSYWVFICFDFYFVVFLIKKENIKLVRERGTIWEELEEEKSWSKYIVWKNE